MLIVVLAGCGPLGDGGKGSSGASPVVAGGSKTDPSPPPRGGCDQPGGQMRHWLPMFEPNRKHEAKIATVTTNPCPPFVELLSQVDQLIPGVEKEAKTVALQFATKLRKLAGHYLAAADTARCLYEADRLVIGVYQHEEYPSSVGVVIAVGRDFDTAIDVAACYLFGDSVRSAPPVSGDDRFRHEICAGSLLPRSSPVVVLRFGTSNWMCDALTRAIPNS